MQCVEFQPELVLLDVVLPGIDGFTTCRELLKRHGKGAPPVIFITAKNAADDIVEGLDAGGVDYVPKPFRQNDVLARIRTHLQIRRLLAAQHALVEQLSRANEAKNKFLGMAAHDLRNPLASSADSRSSCATGLWVNSPQTSSIWSTPCIRPASPCSSW